MLTRLVLFIALVFTLGACEGPEGPTGPRGVTGYAGQDGADGEAGVSVIWQWAGDLDAAQCDYVLSPPSSIRQVVASGNALCVFEVLLEGYWIAATVVWWFDHDYPEAASVLAVHTNGTLRLFNGCGGPCRVRIFG